MAAEGATAGSGGADITAAAAPVAAGSGGGSVDASAPAVISLTEQRGKLLVARLAQFTVQPGGLLSCEDKSLLGSLQDLEGLLSITVNGVTTVRATVWHRCTATLCLSLCDL